MSCKPSADNYIIYIITNKLNQKVYIGQTSRSLEIRMQEHKSTKSGCIKLRNAISKYGSEIFHIEALCSVTQLATANFLENYYIKLFDSIKNGYNLKEGGSNGSPSEETRKLMSEQHKGEKNAMYGKNHSEETKEIISIKKKGHPGYWKGKSLQKETIEKISKSRKGLTTGDLNPSAKLTLAQVEEIKFLVHNSKLTRKQIADKFNVSLSTIKRIKSGTHWK